PSLFLPCHSAHRHLHCFPTRRSSDLDKVGRQFGGVPIQFGDDAIKLFGATIGGVQKPIGPKISKFPLMLAQARQLRQPPQSLQRSEEHTSELQSRVDLVCRLLLEKKQ